MKRIATIFTICILLFIYFGRSVYMPIIHKVRGRQSVESVSNSIEERVEERIRYNLNFAGFESYPNEILMVALKEEQLLEVYGVDGDGTKLIKRYSFTATSGQLGPKLKEGDRQIPEGVYRIEYLNPNSSYYLSMKISYPNEFDKSKTKFSDFKDLGGDIFIHGKAVTIGCVPIGDEAIEEVFILAQNAIMKEIKVIISPWDFRVKHKYPDIESIDWEEELYDLLKSELNMIPKNN